MDADGAHGVILAGLEQRIPERFGLLGREPELVTEVAGKARARDHQLGTLEVDMHQPEDLEFLETFYPHVPEDRIRRRPLHGQGTDIVRFVDD